MQYDLSTYPDDEIDEILDIGLPADAENGPSPDDVANGLFYQAAEDERTRRIKAGIWTRSLMRLVLGAVALFAMVRIGAGQVSTEEAQKRLEERQRVAAIAATQPTALAEENQRLRIEVDQLRAVVASLKSELAAAKKELARVPAPPPALTRPAGPVSNGMTLVEVQAAFHEPGMIRSQIGNVTRYEFVNVGRTIIRGQQAVTSPDAVYTVDIAGGKVVAWQVRSRPN